MNTTREGWFARLFPRTLASRLYLILFAGLLVAHALSFGLLFYERYEAATSMLMSNVEQDVVVSVAILDRLPADQRAAWLPMLRRRTFQYLLGPGESGPPVTDETSRELTTRIAAALGERYPLRANRVADDDEHFQVHLTLGDGQPLTVDVRPSAMPVAKWLPYVLGLQLVLLMLCVGLAVRLATRPLKQWANAAASLGPTGTGERLDERGPVEVARAATAFNAMQDRVARYMQERLQILAAISHDLQTPITRMRLRSEAMDEAPERGKLLDDLTQMEHLVREGIAYARSADSTAEPPVRLDLTAFVESLAYDYMDTGQPVSLSGRVEGAVTTRPHALRRIVANLVDNAIKYGGSAELHLAREDDAVVIRVRDHGPGIPADQLDQVMQPFYRVEASRNRDTGGSGLGLAIAQQLAASLGATLQLHNRTDGLDAVLRLPGRD